MSFDAWGGTKTMQRRMLTVVLHFSGSLAAIASSFSIMEEQAKKVYKCTKLEEQRRQRLDSSL